MDLSQRFDRLTVAAEGGEGTLMLLKEREKPGLKFCGIELTNSYWLLTLSTVRGRAVPLVPCGIYLVYIVVVCIINAYVPLGGVKKPLESLSGVTTTIGVLLFFLLSFRNNAAFNRWQTGTEKFKNFCSMAKLVTRSVGNDIPAFVNVGGPEAIDDILSVLKWVMAAVEVGRQHLRSDKSMIGLHDILSDEEVVELHAKHDPVLYCMYKAVDVDRKYVIFKVCEWMRLLDTMYLEFSGCVNVFTTPTPLAYIAHLRIFLVMWLAIIVWVYVPAFGWFTILLCGLIGYGIIGVEEAAVEVEQPYGKDFNDVPIDWIVADTLKTCELYVKRIRIIREKMVDATKQGKDAAVHDVCREVANGNFGVAERVRGMAAAFERAQDVTADSRSNMV